MVPSLFSLDGADQAITHASAIVYLHSRALPMRLRDILLAITVMAVWGTNFVVIHEALAVLPPLLFAALRFTLAFALPHSS